jgi:hypothetical protein
VNGADTQRVQCRDGICGKPQACQRRWLLGCRRKNAARRPLLGAMVLVVMMMVVVMMMMTMETALLQMLEKGLEARVRVGIAERKVEDILRPVKDECQRHGRVGSAARTAVEEDLVWRDALPAVPAGGADNRGHASRAE